MNLKKNYKVPISYINNVLKNDREFKIFNTLGEQNIYINKWSNPTVQAMSLAIRRPMITHRTRRFKWDIMMMIPRQNKYQRKFLNL